MIGAEQILRHNFSPIVFVKDSIKCPQADKKVCQFIERYCLIPEGSKVGQPIKLLDFQRKFVLDVYDNPAGRSRAYLSVARKNGKSALIAAIVLAHLVGPEAQQNSQIISGARSRDQASLVFKLAEKMSANCKTKWNTKHPAPTPK
jgi:phage terminase large subunit-like protein